MSVQLFAWILQSQQAMKSNNCILFILVTVTKQVSVGDKWKMATKTLKGYSKICPINKYIIWYIEITPNLYNNV